VIKKTLKDFELKLTLQELLMKPSSQKNNWTHLFLQENPCTSTSKEQGRLQDSTTKDPDLVEPSKKQKLMQGSVPRGSPSSSEEKNSKSIITITPDEKPAKTWSNHGDDDIIEHADYITEIVL
jgi:hypothetical protein